MSAIVIAVVEECRFGYVWCRWWSDAAMLLPKPSSPPAYLEVLDECRLLVSREVRAAYVAPDVSAILVTLPEDPPAWAHFDPFHGKSTNNACVKEDSETELKDSLGGHK